MRATHLCIGNKTSKRLTSVQTEVPQTLRQQVVVLTGVYAQLEFTNDTSACVTLPKQISLP